MKYFFTLVTLTTLLIMLSCTKEDQQSAVTGSISGTVSVYDPGTPLETTPMEGITLWLADYDYPFDTITYIGNEKAILDSTFTDAAGNYHFANIPFGNYVVSPAPGTANYQFAPTDPELTLPVSLTETNLDQKINFSAPWPHGENSTFAVYVNIINSDSSDATNYKCGRQGFSWFFPIIVFILDTIPTMPPAPGIPNPYYNTYHYPVSIPPPLSNEIYGATFIITTLTNNFLFDFYNADDVWLESYWITQDLSNTPAESWWTIDLNAHTITRDSISNSANNTNKINNLTLRE